MEGGKPENQEKNLWNTGVPRDQLQQSYSHMSYELEKKLDGTIFPQLSNKTRTDHNDSIRI